MSNPHILLVSRHDYGHLNPAIELANNFKLAGAQVTLATTINGFHKLKSLNGISIASFSDGHDDNPNASMIPDYIHDIKRVGSKTLASLIQTFSEKVTLVVYTLFLPWVAEVARDLHVPSAMLIIQSATCYSIYTRFCNPRDGIAVVNKEIESSTVSLQLPGLPLLKWSDFPTFVLPTSPYFGNMVSVIQDHLKFLEEDPHSRVLVNTMECLETDSVNSIGNAVVVGPLVRSFSTGSVYGSYFQWLDSKESNSVIYVSFGSAAVLSKRQKEEILHGLIDSGRPFLLVLRDNEDEDEDEEIKELIEKIGDGGLVVGWCSQLEVLRHRGVGCFVTHCGWNSTLESMVAGVAVVACPKFADQTTNAKMVEEVWGNGVRAVVDETMVVGRDEIKRCLEVVMGGGERGEEIRKSVDKWKKMAMESVNSSQINLKLFLESIL